MSTANVQVYYGAGKGKSSAAFGRAIYTASEGKNVIIIQFLKGKADTELEFLERLEPEIKFFRFEKSEENYTSLSKEEQIEEVKNMKNGLNYAKKVLATGECSLLILDEVLGLIDNHVIDAEDLIHVLDAKSDDTELILTGRVLDEAMKEYVDDIYNIVLEK